MRLKWLVPSSFQSSVEFGVLQGYDTLFGILNFMLELWVIFIDFPSVLI